MMPCFGSTSQRTVSATARGDELDFEVLRTYFASLRHAFSELRIARALIIGEGAYLAARTRFSGVFTGVFTLSPVGRLAEGWLQTNCRGFLQKLGASSAAAGGVIGSSS